MKYQGAYFTWKKGRKEGGKGDREGRSEVRSEGEMKKKEGEGRRGKRNRRSEAQEGKKRKKKERREKGLPNPRKEIPSGHNHTVQ